MEKYTVIIPALNEEQTIENIIRVFKGLPSITDIHVMVDDRTTDRTQEIANYAGAATWRMVGVQGKGELVEFGLTMVHTENVILSDADYTRFPSNVTYLLAPITLGKEMRIIVPRIPGPAQWEISGFPYPFDLFAWGMMSGLRSFPMEMLKDTTGFHGYLLENQLNQAAERQGYAISRMLENGVVAPLRFTEARMEALKADLQWGRENGVLDG